MPDRANLYNERLETVLSSTGVKLQYCCRLGSRNGLYKYSLLVRLKNSLLLDVGVCSTPYFYIN